MNELKKNNLVPAKKVAEMLIKNREAIMRTLPSGFNFDRMTRTAINAISTNPQLYGATPASLFLACVRAFSLGLEPNGALSEGYLVPFRNKGVLEVVFMPSYRGLISLARRSGMVKLIYAEPVHKNDEFVCEFGENHKLIHRPNFFSDRGEILGYYAVCQLTDGTTAFVVLNNEEIEKIRNCSNASSFGSWVQWPEEMAKKTVIKRLLKTMPMSIEVATAVQTDNAAEKGENLAEIIDIDGLEITEEEPKKSKFEKDFAAPEKPAKNQAETSEKELEKILSKSPANLEQIKEMLSAKNEEFDERKIIANPTQYINRTLNFFEAGK